MSDLGIKYPVAIDNDYDIWRAFKNQYWPAHYFIDAEGRIRYHHFGEGDYEGSERVIQQLLAEAGRPVNMVEKISVTAPGVEAAFRLELGEIAETYVGYDRAENFVSPGGLVHKVAHIYRAGRRSRLNEWALEGDWTVEQRVRAPQRQGRLHRFQVSRPRSSSRAELRR